MTENPKCPDINCRGSTRRTKNINKERCFYKCNRCGHIFVHWKNKPIELLHKSMRDNAEVFRGLS